MNDRHPRPDFAVYNHGSLHAIHPFSPAAKAWLRENIEDGAQYLGEALMVEPRYVDAIVDGMNAAGLV